MNTTISKEEINSIKKKIKRKKKETNEIKQKKKE